MDVLTNISAGKYTNGLEYASDKEAYREENRRLDRLFKADLEEEFGVAGHPKKDLLFTLAWREAHAFGLKDVYLTYEELVELLK